MSPPDERSLLDSLLAEQQQLTAVEQFARAQEREEWPAEQSQYRRLLPAAPPAPGQQYAFEVDLDKCSGCKACVTACHSLNGLDDGETWRDVGILVSEDWRQPFTQTITTACHHCIDPGCLNGCPVLAYEKDPVTGIVRHLDDQCIGCQYCILKCPYEVPKYSERRGIVRKCDLCSQRLAVGEAPACAQACPSEAIRITLAGAEEVHALFQSATTVDTSRKEREKSEKREFASAPLFPLSPAPPFLPASPDPRITLPATRYLSKRGLPANLLAGDDGTVRPSPSHLPLVFLLVLTQLAVGASVNAVFVDRPLPFVLLALVMAATGLGVGLLHLGQPLKAWRSFLGWRKSWFSREIIAFGLFVPLIASVAAAIGFHSPTPEGRDLNPALCSVALAGLFGVFCSAMIYADTRREFWSARQSIGKFFGTTFLLGSAVALAMTNSRTSALALAVATAVKLAFEHRIFRHLQDEETSNLPPLSKTARLLAGPLGPISRTRIACGLLGGIAAPLVILLTSAPPAAFAALALSFAGEWLERYLYFTAVVTRRMPGNPAA